MVLLSVYNSEDKRIKSFKQGKDIMGVLIVCGLPRRRQRMLGEFFLGGATRYTSRRKTSNGLLRNTSRLLSRPITTMIATTNTKMTPMANQGT